MMTSNGVDNEPQCVILGDRDDLYPLESCNDRVSARRDEAQANHHHYHHQKRLHQRDNTKECNTREK